MKSLFKPFSNLTALCNPFIFVLVLVALVSVQGCSLFGDPIAEKVASVIDKYCEEPLQARELYRDTINDELDREGHTIRVDCHGDTGPD